MLFIVQTALIASHRTHVHRRLGVAGAVQAAAKVVQARRSRQRLGAVRRRASILWRSSGLAFMFLLIGIIYDAAWNAIALFLTR